MSKIQRKLAHLLTSESSQLQQYAVCEPLSSKEMERLVFTAQRGDIEARNALIEGNLLRILEMATAFSDRGVSFEDLVEEGIVGFLEGLENFSEGTKVPFHLSSYRWIRTAMLTALMHKDIVDIPRFVRKMQKRCQEFIQRNLRERGYYPTTEELCWELNMTYREYELFRSYPVERFSFDTIIERDQYLLLDETDVCEEVTRRELPTIINEVLVKNLSEVDRQVILLRFFKELTLKECGEKLNMTPARVHQRESRAIATLRSRRYVIN